MTKELAGISERVAELLGMLQYRRPSGSKGERAFISRYLAPLGCLPDEYGNHWLTVGDSPIMWSAHTDTVHAQGGMQKLLYGEGAISVSGSNCLGADCTVGVWLMVQMIRARVPGTYVFHADEEIGGLGSQYIATKSIDRLAGLQYAIAFDRKGTDEIITHQAMERCCSDEFAQSLAGVLAPLGYRKSDGGTFTDTANYTHLIPECTNISVGYYKQHQAGEWLDVIHAERLLDRILVAPWDRLVCARDPLAWDMEDTIGWRAGHSVWRDEAPRYSVARSKLARFCETYPEEVAEFLEAYGFGQSDIEQYCWMEDMTTDDK